MLLLKLRKLSSLLFNLRLAHTEVQHKACSNGSSWKLEVTWSSDVTHQESGKHVNSNTSLTSFASHLVRGRSEGPQELGSNGASSQLSRISTDQGNTLPTRELVRDSKGTWSQSGEWQLARGPAGESVCGSSPPLPTGPSDLLPEMERPFCQGNTLVQAIPYSPGASLSACK